MIPSCVKTEVWRELMEGFAQKFDTSIVCGRALFGKLSFFQELRNRRDDAPFSSVKGVRYVSVSLDDAIIHVGPFRTSEAHVFDEELSDARLKLPEWRDFYGEMFPVVIHQAIVAGRASFCMGDSLDRAKLLLEFAQETSQVKGVDHALRVTLQFLVSKFKLSNVIISAYGRLARHFDSGAEAVEKRIIAQIKSSKSPVFIQNAQSDFLLEGIEERENVPKGIAAFPLLRERELIGFALLFAEQMIDVDRVSEVLRELSGVLSRLSQYEQVQVTAETDLLTGLSNRVTLSKGVPVLLKQLSSKGEPVSVIISDIDNFKRFNDEFGHPEGDKLLKRVADALRESAPKPALCCRYGGEEFVIVLPGADQHVAKAVAESFREKVENDCQTTVSIGLLTCMNSSASWEKLISEADRALYKAKHLGKNRTVAFVMVDKNLGVIDAI